MRLITLPASRTPFQIESADRTIASGFLEPKVADWMAWISSAGNEPAKRCALLSVARCTDQPRAISSWLKASAGKRWPPVPPAQSKAVRVVILSSRCRAARHTGKTDRAAAFRALARESEHEAHGNGHRDEGRTAVRNEGKRHALGWQQVHVHADIDHRLEAEQDDEARKGVAREIIFPVATGNR